MTSQVRAGGPIPSWYPYAVATAAVAAALALRLALDAQLAGQPTLVIFPIAITLSALLGGFRAGLLATALSLLGAGYFLLPPHHSLRLATAAERWQLGFLALAGLSITGLREAVQHARRSAQLARRVQRDTDQAVVASEQRLRDLLDGLGPSMFVGLLTPEGIVLEANQSAMAALGMRREDFLGRPMADTHAWNHSPEVQRQLREALARAAGGEPSRYDVQIRAGDNQLVDIEFALAVLRGKEGAVSFLVASAVDITERKRSVRALQERTEQFRLLADHITDAFWIRSPDMRELQYISPAFEQIWGRSADQLHATEGAWVEFIVPEDRERAQRAFAALRGEARSIETEYRIRRPDGEVRWVRARGFQVRDAEDRLVRLTGIATDVTEQRRASEGVRIAEERMRFALEAAGVGFWDMDYTTGTLRWSAILEAQFGLAPGSFGGTFEEFGARVHPEDREAMLRAVTQAMAAGSDFAVQYRAVWPNGTVRWLTGAGRILLGDQGQPLRGVGISQDVTERRALEEHQQQARKMEAIGQLAGGVAHDFNNLLTGILGYCDLLLADLAPGDARREDVAEIHKAGMSAAALTRQLLAFSRKEIIELKLLDISAIVTGMQPMLERIIREDVRTVFRLRAGLPRVQADRMQVEQIVMNLAVNARDSMPQGGSLMIETSAVELDAHYAALHPATTPGPYVALTVSDTGDGMTPEVQARLYEPFFTTKEQGKGTGLGLATVHGIVGRCGGSINVYSEVGRGTTFKVYFPAADAADPPPVEPAPVVRHRPGTQTILVVDDAEGLRSLSRRLLEAQGYTVLVAADAEEAAALFDLHPTVDLLLTDVVMPGASGPELTRRLLAHRPGLKVIYMSGYTEETIVHHGVLNPGIAFLHKPFTAEALTGLIRQVLDR